MAAMGAKRTTGFGRKQKVRCRPTCRKSRTLTMPKLPSIFCPWRYGLRERVRGADARRRFDPWPRASALASRPRGKRNAGGARTGWRDWLEANRALVLGFTEQRLSRYLQARNPNVPAIVHKLQLPQRRSLTQARLWWAQLIAARRTAVVRDISPCNRSGHHSRWIISCRGPSSRTTSSGTCARPYPG
jgi:hypothetical protein